MHCGGNHLEFPIDVKKDTSCKGPSKGYSSKVLH